MTMTFVKGISVMAGFLMCASIALGQETVPEPAGPAPEAAGKPPGEMLVSRGTSTWSAEAEAGGVATSGNTETRSINAKFKIKNVRDRWDNRLSASYLQASDHSLITAERTVAAFESHYKLGTRSYLFGVVRFDADAFSGYARQLTESTGYGRRFPFSSATTLESEIGAGGRQVRLTDGTEKRDAIVRGAAKFSSKFAQKSEFREEVYCEVSSDNTHTESTTSLQAHINGNLSMKTAYTVTHNSRTPVGVERTDMITSITLVLDFGE